MIFGDFKKKEVIKKTPVKKDSFSKEFKLKTNKMSCKNIQIINRI